MKTKKITLDEFPPPDTLPSQLQVIADIISLPEVIAEARRILTDEVFQEDKCWRAWDELRQMSEEGTPIDFASAYHRIGQDLMRSIAPLMHNSGGMMTAIQHCCTLKDVHIKYKTYSEALSLMMHASDGTRSAQDVIDKVGSFAETIRREIDADKGMQHIADAFNDLGSKIEENIQQRKEGKIIRVPTGFSMLDYLTYGGFNAGNLVILAARPSVGKTAVMLQMAKAAAMAGKAVNLFNLEMTNVELAQRFLFSTGSVTPQQVARGDMEWINFEIGSGKFSNQPIWLNDSAYTEEEIIRYITLNSQAGKCDIAFIDYLGLIRMNAKLPLHQAIAETTKRLKQVAKQCGIPIVLLCQLNRASASENRPPAMYDLRDSGSIEQDADIILMLEKASYEEDGKDVNIWVRKNRQGKAGDIKIEIVGNETFTAFTEKNGREPESIPMPINNDFDNDSDIPF
jgi:replicative DNA helicase